MKEKVAKRWQTFKHVDAAAKYKEHLLKVISTTRVLGNPKPIDVRKIYTDAYFYEKLNAQRRFPGTLHELKALPLESFRQEKRVPAQDVAQTRANLFILGKPGAGKTTFLKFLAVEACHSNHSRTPIFISLKEWSDTSLSLTSFLERSFTSLGFPESQDAGIFLEALLSSGKALVLLDGLDEINEWNSKRAVAISEIANFAKRYLNCQICLTCRLAATDYSFEQFSYMEIADFNRPQQRRFIKQWFGGESGKLTAFQKGWRSSRQRSLREIGRTPLLLALICLAFEENLDFPGRTVDLYKDALEALLKKWDTSRNIRRDDFYKQLPLARKEHLLEQIAAHFYFNKAQVFSENDLIEVVLQFLRRMPDARDATRDNAESVVLAVAAQHGLLVEIISGIYGFSHLTFQEFFTARFVVSNHQSENLLTSLSDIGMADQKWREVIIFTASLLPSADELFDRMLAALMRQRDSHKGLRSLLKIIEIPFREQKGALSQIEASPPLTVAEFRQVSDHILSIWKFLEGKSKQDYGALQVRVRAAKELIERRPQFAAQLLGGYSANPEIIISYFYSCRLIIECLEVSLTSRRENIIDLVMQAKN